VNNILQRGLIGSLLWIATMSGAQAAAAEAKAKSAPARKQASSPARTESPKQTAPSKQAEERPALAQQLATRKGWQGPEAYAVLPEKTIELRAVCPEGADVGDLDELVPPAKKGSVRTFLLSRSTDYRWKIPMGTIEQLGDNRVAWVAPQKPGHYEIGCEIESHGTVRVTAEGSGEKSRELPVFHTATTFHVLVPHEFDPEGRGVIEGSPIGVYPNEKGKDVKAVIADHRDRYQPPRWFVAVTPDLRGLRVSDHFRLGDFVPDAPNDATVYFPYNADLCRVLEAVLAELKTADMAEPHLRILRGFVSPYEAERQRRAGARLLTWNRYQYGDAVLIVANRDGGAKMGDLNGDDKVDVRDAEALSQIVTRVQKRLGLPGWIGVYAEPPDKTLPDTPMVGFDLRGYWAESYGVEPAPRGE